MTAARWGHYPNFTKAEFDCKHTGRNEMQHEFLVRLQQLRDMYGKPIRISSGYRDPSHPVEARKASSGAHSTGLACDIAISGGDAWELLRIAMLLKFAGIGIQQKGPHTGRFIHIDDWVTGPRPNVWSY